VPRFLLTASLISVFAACAPNVRPIPYNLRLLIAVSDVGNQTGETNYDSILDPLAGNVITELQKTECFRIVERQRLRNLLEEMKLGAAGLTDPENSKEVGKILGVDAILFVDLTSVDYNNDQKSIGRIIVKANETFIINSAARLVSVETGEIYASSAYTVTNENSYSHVGMISNGQMADRNEMVLSAMQQSIKPLVIDISRQMQRSGN
jgi:curli biogenesis system outer membrane secretion channel CsgG